jgi:hypothetical protein
MCNGSHISLFLKSRIFFVLRLDSHRRIETAREIDVLAHTPRHTFWRRVRPEASVTLPVGQIAPFCHTVMIDVQMPDNEGLQPKATECPRIRPLLSSPPSPIVTVKPIIAFEHVLVTHLLFRALHPNYFLTILPELVSHALTLHVFVTPVIGLIV